MSVDEFSEGRLLTYTCRVCSRSAVVIVMDPDRRVVFYPCSGCLELRPHVKGREHATSGVGIEADVEGDAP
jgi:hypothetical protein